jgi:hypothetical protein
MARAHSFVITLSNNRTESEGLDLVLSQSRDLFRPDKHGRKQILEVLGLKKEFARAFDLIRVTGANADSNTLPISNPKDITLIELKTTKKRLPNNPYGFFFGATANEFNLAELMGNQFNFAFVCLHPDCPSVKFLTVAQLEPLMRQKRTQFQVNLHGSIGSSSV